MGNINNKKTITTPEEGEELAEFLGILLGDGCVMSNFQVAVSFNYKTEMGYARYVAYLIHRLFGLLAKTRVRQDYHSADLVVSSRALVEYLSSQGIYKGNKIKQGSMLPVWIFKSNETQQASLRGLFDTDGCVYQHSYLVNGTLYQYPKLAFTAYSQKLRKQFFDLLISQGFAPKEYRNRVYLYSQDEALRYYCEIGTKNPWYQRRFEQFCFDLELERAGAS